MTTLGLFPGIGLLACISTIIDFNILSTPWVFTVYVPSMKKSGSLH